MHYGPQAPMNTTAVTAVATAVQGRWACHTRTVLLADAYGRQRCNVVLSECSVVYLWYMSCGLCARERGQPKQTKNYRYVRTRYKIGLIQRHPGNCLIHPRRKKTLRARHASYSARIERKPRPQVPDGVPVSTYLAFWLKVFVRRDTSQNRRPFHK